MSLLSRQLNPVQQKENSRPSVLFSAKQAAGIDRQTILSLATQAFQYFTSINSDFLEYQDLFSFKLKDNDRLMLTMKESQELDSRLNRFLHLLSSHYTPKAIHVLEWLIRRYRVHEFNADSMVLMILAHYSTIEFSTCISLINDPKWLFLKQEKVTRQVVLNGVIANGLLTFLLDFYLNPSCIERISSDTTKKCSDNCANISFICAFLVDYYQQISITDNDLRLILPVILKGLNSCNSDLNSTASIILAVISSKVKFDTIAIDGILDSLLQNNDCCLSVLILFQSQKHDHLSEHHLKLIEGNKSLLQEIIDHSSEYNVDDFLVVFLKQSILFGHSEVVTKILQQSVVSTESMEEVFDCMLETLCTQDDNELVHVLQELQHSHFKELDSCINKLLHNGKSKKVLQERISRIYLGTINQVVSGSTLFLTLNNPKEQVRIAGVKHLRKSFAGNSSGMDTVMMNLMNDTPNVVHQLLKIKGLDSVLEREFLVNQLVKLSLDGNYRICLKEICEYLIYICEKVEKLLSTRVILTLLGSLFGFLLGNREILDLRNKITRICGLDPVSTESVDSLVKRIVNTWGTTEFMEIFVQGINSDMQSASILSFCVINYALANQKLSIGLQMDLLRVFDDYETTCSSCDLGKIEIVDGFFTKRFLSSIAKDNSGKHKAILALITFSNLVSNALVDSEMHWLANSESKDFELLAYQIFSLLIKFGTRSKFLMKIFLERFCRGSVIEFAAYLLSLDVATPAERVTVLSMTYKFISSQTKHVIEINQDYQVLVPVLMVELSHDSNFVRESALGCIRAIEKKISASKSKLIPYGHESFYGKSTNLVLFLKSASVFELLQMLIRLEQGILADFDYLWQNLNHSLTKLSNPKLQNEIVTFISSHIAAHPSSGFRRKLIRLISNVDSTSKILTLSAILEREVQKCADLDFLCCLIDTFFVSKINSIFKKDLSKLHLFLKVLGIRAAPAEETIAKHTIKKISPTWFGRLSLEAQQQIYLALIKLSALGSPDIATAAKESTSLLPLSPEIVSTAFIDISVLFERTSDDTTKRNRNYGSSGRFKLMEAMLESLLLTNGFQMIHKLLPSIVSALEKLILSVNAENTKTDYIQQLLLQVYELILNDGEIIESFSEESLRADLIVQCVRVTDNPQTHNLALILLSTMARTHPKAILVNIMPIFTFMGANVIRKDDNYSFQVVQKTLETVIPAIIAHGGENGDCVKSILTVFVDALIHIPSHRRLRLFTKLISVVGTCDFLGYLTAQLLAHPSSTSEQSSKYQDAFSVKNFAVEVVQKFSAKEQLQTVHSLGEMLLNLPNQKNSDEPIAYFEERTLNTRTLRLIKVGLSQVVNSILSSLRITSEGINFEDCKQLFRDLIELQVSLISNVKNEPCSGRFQGRAKYYSLLTNLLTMNFTLVNDLIPFEEYLLIFENLIYSSNSEVQINAVKVLNERLTLSTAEYSFDTTIELLCKVFTDAQYHKHSSQLRSHAVKCLSSLMAIMGTRDLEAVMKVLSIFVSPQGILDGNPEIQQAVMESLPSLVKVLGPRILPFMSKVFKPTIKNILQSLEISSENCNLILEAGMKCLQSGFENIPQFMSPFISPIVEVLADPKIEPIGLGEGTTSCTRSITENVAHRVVFQEVSKLMTNVLISKPLWINFGLRLLNDSLISAKQQEVVELSMEWVEFFLTIFDHQIELQKLSAEPITSNQPVLDLFTRFTLKMTEKVFKPVLLRLVDWAFTDVEAAELFDRQVVFFNVTSCLVQALQSIFVPYWSYFMDYALRTLSTVPTTNLWKSCVNSLTSMLSFDTSGFLTKERFDQIAPLLVEQISLEKMQKVKNINQEEFLNKAVPCIGALAKACRDESCWKYLNKQVLLKSRSESVAARHLSLLILSEMYKALGVEMLIFFPETIPFLAELMEDEDQEVLEACQKLCLQIQDFLGEPIQPYFSTK